MRADLAPLLQSTQLLRMSPSILLQCILGQDIYSSPPEAPGETEGLASAYLFGAEN